MVNRLLIEANFSQSLLDTVGALITGRDLKGRFVSFNGACEKLN